MFRKRIITVLERVKSFSSWVWHHQKSKMARRRCQDGLAQIESRLSRNEKARRAIDFARGNKRKLLWCGLGLVILVIAANFIFPLHKKPQAVERIIRGDVFAVKPVNFADKLLTMGLVRGEQSADLSFQSGGVVAKIFIKEGNKANKGDTIAQLDDTDARLKVEYNQSKLMAAKEKYEVQKQLFKLQSIILAKLEEARYEYESQEKELEFANQEMEKTKLRAPFDGMVGPFDVEEGESVNPHNKVTSIFNLGAIYVDVGIIEKDVSKIKRDNVAKITVDAYPDSIRDGKVVSISPVIEGKSRNFRVRIEAFNQDPNHLFLPGMFARAAITVYAKANALVVPVSSVKDDMVYVVKNGKVSPQVIKTGYKSYDYLEVLEGLSGGEEIVAEVEGDIGRNTSIEVVNKREYSAEK
jgi:RND family efflux transporter MFP subunit